MMRLPNLGNWARAVKVSAPPTPNIPWFWLDLAIIAVVIGVVCYLRKQEISNFFYTRAACLDSCSFWSEMYFGQFFFHSMHKKKAASARDTKKEYSSEI